MSRTLSSLKCIAAVSAAATIALSLDAVEVTTEQAGRAVDSWLQNDPSLGCTLGDAVTEVRTCTTTNGTPFYVVKLDGGGFVVTSADTALAPIVAFSPSNDLVESDDNPLWVLLKKDFEIRAQGLEGTNSSKRQMKAAANPENGSVQAENEAQWEKLLGGRARLRAGADDGVNSISDVRVAPFIQSKWNQEDVGSDHCFNYYTPNNYPCGCVATAGAQIMRYFMWPSVSATFTPFTNPYCKVNGTTISRTTQGGSYDWAMMPLEPSSQMSAQERQAIGKLTSDIGICCGMSYESDSSSAGGYMLAEALTNHFGYGSAIAAQWDDGSGDQSQSLAFRRALLSNLNANLPVVLSISAAHSGHALIGDGYGYSDNKLYIHLNLGWSGNGDAWYSPPQLNMGGINFNMIDGIVFNILKTLPASTIICSGRVLDANGVPVENAVVSYYMPNAASGGGISSGNDSGYVRTNAKGIYVLFLQPGQYVVSATVGSDSASASVTVSANRGTKIITQGGDFGRYYPSPQPVINNICDQDLILSNVASVAAPQFDPPSCLFYPSTNVTITCSTSGATIRYTLDGTTPTENSTTYSGPIAISDDTTITVRAWKDGMNPSVVVSATYTYDASQGAPKGDYFADPIIITGMDGSRTISDNLLYTVESGEPWHTLGKDGRYYYQYHTIWYQWTAPGSGAMSFRARRLGTYYYGSALAVYEGDSLTSLTRLAYATTVSVHENYFAVLTVNVEQGKTYRIAGVDMINPSDEESGEFTLTWSGNLTVAQTETENTPEPVPYTWLDTYFPSAATVGYETLAWHDSDGDGYQNWEEYVLQTNPTNAESKLSVSIRMEGGVPHVEYEPTSFLGGYRAIIKGSNDLKASPDNWVPITAPTGAFHFFKVVVEPVQ